jgi:hypothetical protein
MAFNYVEADCGTLDDFLAKWHQVRVQLKLDTYTGSVWVDGRVVFDGVPLRQTPDAALIPELMITCGADKPAGVWIEDIEVKYRDQTLKPKNEGEEVSQSIVSDSFETYQTGIFPRTGGWLTGMEKILGSSSEIRPGETSADALNVRPAGSLKDKGKRLGKAKTETEGESRGSEVFRSGRQGAQALNLSDGASENGAALIDDEDSVSGLRSFRLETVGIGSISVVKRFSLPDRVPFGVSGGSFAIGVKLDGSQKGTGLRELLDRESRLDRRSGKLGKENDPVTGPTSGVKNERNLPADSRSAETHPNQGSAGSRKTMTTPSASPVGNYYFYSFDGKLLQTYNVYGVLLKDYIYMGDRLIAEYDHVGSRYLYYTPDQINTTRVVTDSAGTVVYSAAHDPYGGIQQTWVSTYKPLGMEALTAKQRAALERTAAQMVNVTLYPDKPEEGGANSTFEHADCNGAVYLVYTINGFAYVNKAADDTFAKSTEPGGENYGVIVKLSDQSNPQLMDVGLQNGHMVMFAEKKIGSDGKEEIWVYSARRTGKRYGLCPLSWFSSAGPVTWYSYEVTDAKKYRGGTR